MEKCPYGVVIPVTLGKQWSYFVPPWGEGVVAEFRTHGIPVMNSNPISGMWRTIPQTDTCTGTLTMQSKPFIEGSKIVSVKCSTCPVAFESNAWTSESLDTALAVWLIAGMQGSTSELVQSPFVRYDRTGSEYACLDLLVSSGIGSVLLALVPDEYHKLAGAQAMAYIMKEMTEASQDCAHRIARLRGFRDFPVPKH